MTKDMKSPVSGKLPALMAVAAINKAIDDVLSIAATVQEQIQQAGLQCLMHLEKHGDVGPCNRLYLGMPRGQRSEALAKWLLAYGALEVNMTPDTRKTMPLRFAKGKDTKPEAALEDPWYMHATPKKIEDVFDLQKALHGLLQRAKDKTITLGGKPLRTEHAESTLRALAAMAGEDYTPAVNQDTAVVVAARGTETDGGDPPSAAPKPEVNRVKGGVKAAATRSKPVTA